MVAYRLSRRSFLAGVGGAFGLQILLRNLEAAAEGAKSPPRFLMTFWPTGTMRQRYLPQGGRTDFTISPILAPFAKAGLREDLIILYGLAYRNRCPSGGGSEAGTVFGSTGADSAGTRQNGGEGDDAVAGGPSFDQIFLKRAKNLSRPGLGYINTICDQRVDSNETSTQCLSYAYEQRSIESAMGPLIPENIPLLPVLEPLTAYTKLFSGFVPGGSTQAEMVLALKKRKSVLDSALRELARLKTLAPASQVPKIEAHTAAIRELELALQAKLDAGATADTCTPPTAPAANLGGKIGSSFDYGKAKTDHADNDWLEQAGKLHLALIRTAFQCDLIRAATFQWCPATNHVAFKGMNPGDPEGAYFHHAFLAERQEGTFWSGAQSGDNVYEFACNAETWFHQQTADALVEFKNTKDAFGGSLLDHTITTFITDEADPSDAWQPLPSLIVGGRALGMLGGQFVNVSPSMVHSSMWLSVAQAYFPDEDPMKVLADEAFMKGTGRPTGPIEGLWQRPA